MTASDLEEDVQRIKYAIWGLTGDNGLISDLRQHKADFRAYVEREEKRRLEEVDRQKSRDRALLIAAFGAIGTLMTVIVTLIVLVAQ